MLARTFGCSRVVYNDALALRRDRWSEHHEPVPYKDLDRLCITEAKTRTDRAWLAEVSTVALQQAVRDAHQAYQNWWKHGAAPPRFRRKTGRQAFRLTRRGFRIRGAGDGTDRAKVHLAKIGWVKVAWSRPLPSHPTSVTVVREPDGRYYLSFVCQTDNTRPAGHALSAGCGIDVGLTHLATIAYTDGTTEKIDNPRPLRAAERRLARAQRSLARKKGARKGEPQSANYQRQARKVAALHRQVRDIRHDHLRKLAHRLVHENQVVAVEALNLRGLTRTRMARSIHDASWATLRRFLEEAAERHPDRQVTAVDPRGTSRRCSTCGCDSGTKPLHVRTWTCGCCGTSHDRDINAATNVMVAAGLAETQNACGQHIRPPSPPGTAAALNEAGTHRADHPTTGAA